MKILLIGIGRWGKNHFKVLPGLCDELFVSDIEKSMIEGLPIDKEHFSTSYQDFIDRVDAVDIVTATDTHFRLVMECLGRGKHVFVEKPIAMHTGEARLMQKEADERHLTLQVGHIYRYHPNTARVKQCIENGELGEIRYAYGHFMRFKRPRMDVGVTQTDAIHYFDLFNYLLGSLPDKVTSTVKHYLKLPHDDTSVSILDYQGKMVFVEASYMTPENRRDIVIIGDKASLQCNYEKTYFVIFEGHHELKDGEWVATEGNVRPVFTGDTQPLLIELGSFVKSIKDQSKPLADGKVGYEALKIVEACHESSMKEKTVEIKWS